jgi:hypothetical protein
MPTEQRGRKHTLGVIYTTHGALQSVMTGAYRCRMATDEAYRAACIELFSRLWAELEQLCSSREQAELLRLEIHLLGEAVESTRWRLILDDAQRQGVTAALQDVLHALEKQAEAASATLTAQNRLLDAVHFHWDEACTPPQRLRPTGS